MRQIGDINLNWHVSGRGSIAQWESIHPESGRSRVQSQATPSLFHWMVVKCYQGPGFNSLAIDTFALNWKTLPFPPSRNGLPFNATTPGNKLHSTYFQKWHFQVISTHLVLKNCKKTVFKKNHQNIIDTGCENK